MIRVLPIFLAAALIAASSAFALPPKLKVTSGAQFSVRGSRFQPLEHVVVSVTTSGGRQSRRLRAGPAGGFIVRFATVQISSCEAYSVRATGDEGSHSTLIVRPAECPQPLTP